MKTKKPHTKTTLLTTLLLLTTTAAQPHSLWIQPDPNNKPTIHFGEFPDEPETTPGHLDTLAPPTAWQTNPTNNQPQPLKPTKQKNGYQLPQANPSQPIQTQANYPVITRANNPPRKPIFYARWTPNLTQPQTPTLTLDIIPTGKPGQLQILFRGKPLPNATLTHYTPQANDQEHTTNHNGTIQIQNTEKGLHMLKIARHSEPQHGYHNGKPYHIISHNTSLTWTQK